MHPATQTLERPAPPAAVPEAPGAPGGIVTAPLEHATVEVVGVPFQAIWSPEDGAIRAAGFAEVVGVGDRTAAARGARGSDGGGSDGGAHGTRRVRGDRDGIATEPRRLMDRLARLDPALAARGLSAEPGAGPVVAALRAYAAGDLDALDALPVAQPETPFRGEVWRALRGVSAGSAVTYTELAARAGRPAAVRAAASGCANNLVALVVPCHRIVRADGGLGGYLFGVELKERLLRHEGALRTR